MGTITIINVGPAPISVRITGGDDSLTPILPGGQGKWERDKPEVATILKVSGVEELPVEPGKTYTIGL